MPTRAAARKIPRIRPVPGIRAARPNSRLIKGGRGLPKVMPQSPQKGAIPKSGLRLLPKRTGGRKGTGPGAQFNLGKHSRRIEKGTGQPTKMMRQGGGGTAGSIPKASSGARPEAEVARSPYEKLKQLVAERRGNAMRELIEQLEWGKTKKYVKMLPEELRAKREEILKRIFGEVEAEEERIHSWNDFRRFVNEMGIDVDEYKRLFTEEERRLLYIFFNPGRSILNRGRPPPH